MKRIKKLKGGDSDSDDDKIKERPTKRQRLDVLLDPNVNPEVKKLVTEMHAGYLNLYSNHRILDATDANILAKELKSNESVMSLFLSDNQIGNAGAQAIAEALGAGTVYPEGEGNVYTSLNLLDLDNNSIGDAGAHALAEALLVNASLKRLNLNDNKIGDDGARAIADALNVNTALMELNLSKNQIGASGTQAISDALKVNKSLTRLNLDNNPIGDAGAQSIADALKVNESLIYLNLWGTGIGPEGVEAITDSIQKNYKICQIGMDSIIREQESNKIYLPEIYF